MADRDIPQFDNDPPIMLQVAHSGGILDTVGENAPVEMTILVEGEENDWQIPAYGLDHTDPANARIIKGKPVPCNVGADIPDGFSVELDEFNCKVEIIRSLVPLRSMTAPTSGVFTMKITPNVRGADGLPAGAASGSGE